MIQKFEQLQSSPQLAMSALNYIDNSRESLNDSVLTKLLVLYYNKKNSDESRLEALSVLLNRFEHLLIENDSPILENILHSLFKAKSKDFLFYGQQLLKNKINSNHKFRQKNFWSVEERAFENKLVWFLQYSWSLYFRFKHIA